MTTLDNKTVDESPSTAEAAQAESSGQVELDLSLETLSRDLVHVIYQTQTRMGWEKLPDIVLVGHSLGGAVITDVAKKGELGPKLLAYAVLDVVEGTPALAVYVYQILISFLKDLQWMLSRAWRNIFRLVRPDSPPCCLGLNGSMYPSGLSFLPIMANKYHKYSLPHNPEHYFRSRLGSVPLVRRKRA
jgi:pimeloyl-ACP methyl ester carboxylesterase